MKRKLIAVFVVVYAFLMLAGVQVQAADPLPSWNEGKGRQSIVAFVEKVTNPGSPDFVPHPERIAVFDNDGCSGANSHFIFRSYLPSTR